MDERIKPQNSIILVEVLEVGKKKKSIRNKRNEAKLMNMDRNPWGEQFSRPCKMAFAGDQQASPIYNSASLGFCNVGLHSTVRVRTGGGVWFLQCDTSLVLPNFWC
ncbi:conserved hypothetical protein [Ricinus communis]|uniref:Uncharacterized protein n=1 Tax=Ricinus communis TaxID=3988 RepID=B9SLX0_RICCO|nr:conserved hypothetical protein [Ricinus communis]